MYKVENNSILLNFPAKNDGKFRFKKRENKFGFGKTFSTRNEEFNFNTYLEWQIGYDVSINEINIKKTKLIKKNFVGSNGKTKYPYELSEIFYEAIKLNFITLKDIDLLIDYILSVKTFIDENPIIVNYKFENMINNILFQETSVNLPTFYYFCKDDTQIEISIQKQQYATGIQPMVYYCIPFKCFKNKNILLNKTSKVKDELIYEINQKNIENLILLFKIFGMTSQKHQHDIIEILKILKNYDGVI